MPGGRSGPVRGSTAGCGARSRSPRSWRSAATRSSPCMCGPRCATGSASTSSRRSCCRPRSTAACPLRTRRSRSPRRCSRRNESGPPAPVRETVTRTQVGIVGAGPAGLTLARLLEQAGIESVVLESRSREHVEHRIRAGVLEQGTVELLREAGVGARLESEGIVHHGIELQFEGERHRVPLTELAGGRTITIYGQTEVVKDLIAARLASDLPLRFETEVASVEGIDSERPVIRYRDESGEGELECDVVAGCDGFHGACRRAVAPSNDELIYSGHERGFALLSLRSPELSRLYIQCRPDEDLAEWPDDRIWQELHLRLGLDGWTLAEGPVLEKGVTGMRSYVVEPMQHGRLFLAGDAAHIVPPTGAKGLNLAIADVRILAEALVEWYGSGSASGLATY